jgi:hypothetical protein
MATKSVLPAHVGREGEHQPSRRQFIKKLFGGIITQLFCRIIILPFEIFAFLHRFHFKETLSWRQKVYYLT